MLSPLSRDSLDGDRDTLVFEPRRNTVRIHGQRVPSLLNRCGVDRRQWDHLAHCWMAPVRFLPVLFEQAEKDRRNVLIEDHGGLAE
ncbi:hypothetical protein E9529_12605 [Blastococcus sp. KM273128]|uniref:hypothetical protein n=1 Tax=Blastococcus sp. KM273128 TaxID=2570314 RepID=UPI001F19A592|nr:hypothetical protein [Blastococcus sp. KM273128]MCF6745106.1 hypothetical protein [Blastococcus sp. KM273128]